MVMNLIGCFFSDNYCFWYRNGTNNGNKHEHKSISQVIRVNNLENLCNSLSSGGTVSPSTAIFVDEVSQFVKVGASNRVVWLQFESHQVALFCFF